MKKRILSLVLALVLCLSLLPTAALANEIELTKATQSLGSTHTYKLNEDVTLDNVYGYLTVNPDANATLDLNGHVLTGTDSRVIYYGIGADNLSKSATLTLIDSNPTAVHYFTVDSDGRWSLCPTEGHTHDETCRKVTGGCIVSGSTSYCVQVDSSKKTFIMKGGNLIGGQKNGSIGVQVNGSFIMEGGSIQGCRSSRFGSVLVGLGAKITLGGDPNKTVTIADTSTGGSGVWLDNAYNGSPAAKLTVGVMKDGSSFTVQRKDGAKLTYVGDLDLTTATDDVTETYYIWDSDEKILELKNACCTTVKLPCDSTVKGSGYAQLIRSDGTIEGNLTFDGATIEVGSIMWHHNDAGPKIILKNGSTLTATGEGGLFAGGYDIQDSSTLVLDGAPISSSSEGVIDDLNDCLPDGKTYYANNEGSAKYLHKTENSTEGSDRVTSETFRRYCEVKFYSGDRGEFAEGTKTELRVPYGSTVTPPTATPNDPDSFACTGWEREDNSLKVDTTINDPITADRVAFTAKYERFETKSFDYTNNIVLGGTVAPTAQEFELEVINSDHTPMNAATVSGGKTQVTASTVFSEDTTTGKTQAALTGQLTLKGLPAQLGENGETFPCFVRQKAVTADGWTTATEAYLLAYDTQIEQGEEEDSPTLKIYPAEEGEDGTYEIESDAEGIAKPVVRMTFTNTYTDPWSEPTYTVTFEANGGSDVDPQKVVSGQTATEPAAPTRDGYTFGGWYTDESLRTAYDFETPVTGDLTLYARWIFNRGASSSGTYYFIKTSVSTGGSITPSGTVRVRRGADRSFTITPAAGYAVCSVLVDGEEVGARTSYKFENVHENHTICVTFQRNLPKGLNYLDHNAYVQGYPDGTVLPDGSITRAETAMMFYRLLTAERRAEIETSACSFTDVRADAWYRTAAATMAAGGYLAGYADGSFGGERLITRAEFIAALVRFLGVRDVTCSFFDVPTRHWAYAYVATAADAGWVTGDHGAFRPDEAITRAEAMVIINRALCRGVDDGSELLSFKRYPDNVFGAWYYYEVIEATNGHTYTGARPSEDWTSLQ